jgi:Metal-dependent hydrolase
VTTLKIVSYNIHKGRSAMGTRESLAALRLGLYNLQPDLVFLQEVQGRNEKRYSLDGQHESLAAVLNMQVAYGCNAIRPRSDHGNALLSRFPILQFENQDVSDHRMEQRGLLHAVVEIKGTPVHCLVVHLGLFGGGRSRQVAALVERIKRLVPEDEPILIAGDFNDWNNRLAPLFVEQLGLYEVFAVAPQVQDPRLLRRIRHTLAVKPKALAQTVHELGVNGAARLTPPPRTFPAAFPWLRLDRIYQRGFAVHSAKVLHGAPWRQISDHAPLLAELELP